MNCTCGEEMKFRACYDTCTDGPPDYAWNLYVCFSCGEIAKQSVWDKAGVIRISVDNRIGRDARGVLQKPPGVTEVEWEKSFDEALADAEDARSKLGQVESGEIVREGARSYVK